MNGYWAIDTADGNELAAGMDEITARRCAQRYADERGECVTLYTVGFLPRIVEEIEPDTAKGEA